MDTLFTKRFWQGAIERAIKTAAQVFLVGAGLSNSVTGVLEINWIGALSLAAGGALASFLTSIISAQATNTDSPSLVKDAK